jgi:hypothetical protein
MLHRASDGTYSYHGMAADEASFAYTGNVFVIQRPDGLYAKVVWTERSAEACVEYVAARGWKLRR